MIDIRVDIRGVIAGLDRIRKIDTRRVFREARKPVRADLRDHAQKMEGPGGRWPARAASTRERRGNRGRLLRRLPTAWAMTHDALRVRAVSMVKWSAAHWTGARVGHGTRLPKRDFAWVSSTLRRTVRNMFVDALKRAWKGG